MPARRKWKPPAAPSRSLANALRSLPLDTEAAEEVNSARQSAIDGFFTQALFSPDGTCVLAAREGDSKVRVYEGDKEALWAQEPSAAIYGMAWYPLMQSTRPETCAFAAMSRNAPVHLWDAFANNYVRASYTAQDSRGEPVTGLISIALGAHAVYAGGRRGSVLVWDLTCPGVPLRGLSSSGIGLVSSIDATRADFLAVGGFDGRVGLMDLRRKDALTWRCDGASSCTRIRVRDHLVWVGGRRADFIDCFDARGTSTEPVVRIPRRTPTNQRIDFDLRGTRLVTGTCSEGAEVWDTINTKRLVSFGIKESTANSVSFDPTCSFGERVAVASGTRALPGASIRDSDSDDGNEKKSTSRRLADAPAQGSALTVWSLSL